MSYEHGRFVGCGHKTVVDWDDVDADPSRWFWLGPCGCCWPYIPGKRAWPVCAEHGTRALFLDSEQLGYVRDGREDQPAKR